MGGFAGQVSFGHAAFFGLGGFVSARLVLAGAVPAPLAWLAGALAAGLVALFLGMIILRLRGVYFVLVTFAFGELVRLILLDFPSITGGANGITGIPPPAVFGVVLASQPAIYLFALLVAALMMAFKTALVTSPVGRAFDSIADNLALAEGSGICARRYQVVAFTIGSAITGGMGAILASYVGYISPESFAFSLSLNFIIMLVVGGRASLIGPLLGALFLTPLPEFLRGTLALQHILYGVALVAILRFLPAGLGGVVDRAWNRVISGAGGRA
jgi:branched-chain amino acid transport system permease protein